MTAVGTACNGAGEAPKAEFVVEKAAAAVKAPAERNGEDVGGPFVIVNGDSDGLSDRGSDLGKAHDEDSPSEEDEVLGSNATPDEPVVGDHGAAAGEAGASAVASGVSSADDRDRAAEKPEGGADEGKGEPSADLVTAEVAQQETAGSEQGGADAVLASGSDRAITGSGSDSPAVDSEANGKEGTKEDSAELVVDEAPSSEQKEESVATESCGHDGAATKTESSSTAIESEVHVDDNREEESAATEAEPMVESTGGPDALIASAHHCEDTNADSFEAAAEPERHDDNEIKSGHSSSEVVKLVEQGGACVEKDGEDALQTNGHANVAVNSDSGIVASGSEVYVNETEVQESDQQEEGEPSTEDEVERTVETAGKDLTGSVESTEEIVHADVHSYANINADASGETESVTEKVEDEVTCGIIQVEEKMDKDGEGGSCDDLTAGVDSNKEVKLPAEEGINEAVPSVGELEAATQDTSQEIAQGDGLAKDGETDPSVETSMETNSHVGIGEVDGAATESYLKSDSVVEVKTVAPLLSQQNCDSMVETIDKEQLERPCQSNETENDIAQAEAKKEVETEVSDVVPFQAAAPSAASTIHAEPQLIDLESRDQTHSVESRSQDISDTIVDQLVSGASQEHGSTVVQESELSSVTRDESQAKLSVTADQGETVTMNADELVADDAKPSSATGSESVQINTVGDISKKDESSDVSEDSKLHEDQSESCNTCTTCDAAEYISAKSLNASSKSSDVVETKYSEALVPSSVGMVILAEHKVDDGHAQAKVVEDSKELHGDLDKSNVGYAQAIRQQKIYIIKVPKFAGEDIWAKIQDAQTQLDKLTQERDTINIRKHKQKFVCDQYREKLEAVRREEREARVAHGDKKNDLNSVRSVIGKLNQANSIEEIEEMIVTKERIMQHETISLKEEKLLIKEINDLKAQRKQLCSSMGSKAEINEAFDQKEHIHERHKTLKKDSDVLFSNLKSLGENTKKIQKSFEDERIVLRKLNEEYRVANEKRQKAYIDWAELKAEPYKKNKYFFMYKDDKKIAGVHVASGNMHQLQMYCNNQVERVMELWNKDKDFRKQYVEANKIITLKKFGTHDGRRLGPDEDPPVIPSRRPSNLSSSLTVSSPNVPTTTSAPAPAPVVVSVKEDSFPVLSSPDVSKRAKSKASDTPAQNEKIAVTVSERDIKEIEKEKARLMEEELERAKKAEELARIEEKLREERAAAEKERLRLEQKAKAKEAEERKRRKAEKAQERAEFKARKEAEMKEKKKAKKDKKKGQTDASSSGNATALATAETDSNASDNPREIEVPQPTAHKRISRPAAAVKQLNRLEPMPAPLRNRGKRKMRQYILIAAAVLSVLALFVAGNYLPRLKSLHS